MRETTRHFKNRVLWLVAEALGKSHRFAVATLLWINSRVDHKIRQIVGILKDVLIEARRPLTEWVQLAPIFQCTLNAAYRDRYRAKVILSLEPGRPFTTLAAGGDT